MASTTNYQIPYPEVTDKVRIASYDMKAMATKVDTALVEVRGQASWARGLLDGTEDVLSLAPGVWVVGSTAVAESVANLPEAALGTIIVEGVVSGSSVRTVRFVPYAATHEWENRTRTLAGAWRGWQRVESGGSYTQPAIREPVDLDTVLTPGVRALPTPYPTGFTNTPEGNNGPSILSVYTSDGQAWAAQEIIQYGANPRRWWRVGRSYSQGLWNDWIEITSGGGGGGEGQSFSTNALSLGAREMRLQMFRDAYPLVSTGGKGVVVFRYDHGLTNFKNVLKPLHDQYGIKAYIAMNSRNWALTENSGATQAEAKAWGNVEWGNHTTDHNDQQGIEAIYDSIVNGRAELEEQLGRTIHGFTVPGLVANGDATDKFEGWGMGGASGYSNTYAGGLILSHHAIVSGTVGSAHRPLDGQIRLGGRHFTWESAAWEDIKAQIDQAVTDKTALTLMCHPRTMGATSGGSNYWDAALAEQVIAYVRERIDAGDLADLSYYQSHHAQLAALPTPTYKSGLRDVSGELLNGWTGSLFVEREGSTVFFRGNLNGSAATDTTAWMLPSGFRPGFVQSLGGSIDYGGGMVWTSVNSGAPQIRRVNHYANRFQVVSGTGLNDSYTVNYSIRTRDAAPSTLPGAPA